MSFLQEPVSLRWSSAIIPRLIQSSRIYLITSPYLETLILHGFDVVGPLDPAGDADTTPITITVPTTLKSLAVNLYRPHSDSTTSCCVLGSLCIPNLEYLEVVGTSVLDIDIDLNVHFGQLDKLQTLRIQNCTLSSANEEFFLSLKELRRLELVDMSVEDMRHIADPSVVFVLFSLVYLPSSFPRQEGT